MLSDKLFNLPCFVRQYISLLELSVCNTIPNLVREAEEKLLLENIDWNNVISISSALCFSNKNEHLDAALRISQTALQYKSVSKTKKEAAAVVLNSLTNKPAIDLAIQRGLIDSGFEDHLPFSIKLQNLKTDIENSVLLDDGLLYLNRFQKRVHDSYFEYDALSISAPTSSGKSFILCNLVLEEVCKQTYMVIYLVPTRALISQVEADLFELFSKKSLTEVNISTVPQAINELKAKSNVLVFTQERLHWFLIENSDVTIDVIIVDEAHKIEDGHRGILLQQKLEQVTKNNPELRIYFSSPYTANPELLLDGLGNFSKKDTINTQFVSVNQNLLFASQVVRKTDHWKLTLCLPDKSIPLGIVKLHDRPTNEKKKVVFLLNAISGDAGGNIIYCNGAAEAEKTAKLLSTTQEVKSIPTEINELIKLVKKIIHNDYSLVKALEKKIAFHYGNMPLLIRQEIEKLFKNGVIKHLLCTPTLLEGVNLPARTIFIRKPTRGPGKPLNQSDFWNLAGRAGRWGKEFSGNIVCIDALKWDVPPNPKKSKQVINKAVDNVEKNGDELIDYILKGRDGNVVEIDDKLEFAFGYYYCKFLTKSLDKDNSFHNQIESILNEISKNIEVPNYIIIRNPGISPIAQQDLLNYFDSKEDDIESLIPVYPEDENAFEEYTNLVGRIGKTISRYPYQLNKSRAILLINWISGKPLSYIIRSSQKSYSKSNGTTKKLSTIIRNVMSDVENFARFRFAKDSSCYIDILRYYLEIKNRKELLDRIPQLGLWLEFGVSQKTHLSLLSLGLGRSTVIELTDLITNSEMTGEESLEWLRSQDFDSMELSPIILEDIKKNI